MSDFDQYLDHFPVGLKITIGIPVPSGDTFQDWAIIHSIDEDLLSLQLSRDTLPDGVKIHVGTIVDIRAGNEQSGYACRAIIVSEGYRREILLRLIGEIVTSELREFYRIDAFLPIKYSISTEQSEVKLKAAWRESREVRIAAEKERKQLLKKPWERHKETPANEEVPAEKQENEELWDDNGEGDEEQIADDGRDHSWDDVIPLAANISGGGLRILLHHKFEENTLVPIEIYLPVEPEPRVIDAVVMVAFANENYAATKQFNRTSYNTGLKFKFIDERDRDAIVSYISNVQLKRIRQLREQYLFRGGADAADQASRINPADRRRMALKSAFILLFVFVSLIMLFFYFKGYTENRPKNEIELIFEKGFGEYLKKSGRLPPPAQ